jgi:hypothetical protein
MAEIVSLEGPVEMIDGELAVLIPPEAGGAVLAPLASGAVGSSRVSTYAFVDTSGNQRAYVRSAMERSLCAGWRLTYVMGAPLFRSSDANVWSIWCGPPRSRSAAITLRRVENTIEPLTHV